jgi:hypothetical protein
MQMIAHVHGCDSQRMNVCLIQQAFHPRTGPVRNHTNLQHALLQHKVCAPGLRDVLLDGAAGGPVVEEACHTAVDLEGGDEKEAALQHVDLPVVWVCGCVGVWVCGCVCVGGASMTVGGGEGGQVLVGLSEVQEIWVAWGQQVEQAKVMGVAGSTAGSREELPTMWARNSSLLAAAFLPVASE